MVALVEPAAFFEQYFRWVQEKPGQSDGAHTVGVKMSAVKLRERSPDAYPWGHGSYAEGRLGWAGDRMTGRLRVLFSDRRTAEACRFARDKDDIQDVTVHADGGVDVTLVTWGSTLLHLEDVSCHPDGFVTAIKREGNGVSLVTLLVRKEIMRPGSDGFRDWP